MATERLWWALRSTVLIKSCLLRSVMGPQIHEKDQITVVFKISFVPVLGQKVVISYS